ncbi:unnamed protein product [Spirodela intermedia]|uniref:Uncharacterized protein n=1 Tax=Spirodela intermedia TaxID=51605 RepID=A0A7I8J033_SPIIN|nr:unnamed protein product [Spirodela intermedia]CAA6662660.1 unnamed protein product [Spirodela intermedia]
MSNSSNRIMAINHLKKTETSTLTKVWENGDAWM